MSPGFAGCHGQASRGQRTARSATPAGAVDRALPITKLVGHSLIVAGLRARKGADRDAYLGNDKGTYGAGGIDCPVWLRL